MIKIRPDLNTERSEEFFSLRIPFEINKQKKKNKKMDLKKKKRESHGSWGHKLCRTDLEKKKSPSDIGMKTKKLRILIAQIVWQRSVGSLFPLQHLKKKIPSDLMYAICVCEICGILFFLLF